MRPTTLYKYRGGNFQRDLTALEKDFVWASGIDALNDPFEATVLINRNAFEALGHLVQDASGSHASAVDPAMGDFMATVDKTVANLRRFGVISLAENHLDHLSWAYYASSYTGYCIEFDAETLLHLQMRQDLFLQVRYQDVPPALSPDVFLLDSNRLSSTLAQRMIGTQTVLWEHEREWRIVRAEPGEAHYDYRAVRRVLFGHRMPRDEREELMKRLSGRGIAYAEVGPVRGSYELRVDPVDDSFPHTPRYLHWPAEIEGEVPLIDEAMRAKGYSELLRRAVEVARWDPYCHRVIDAYEAGSRSSASEPVFYVTVMGPDGLPRNVFLSKTQIEAHGGMG